MLDCAEELANPQETLGVIAEQPGYVSHILMREVGNPSVLACLAHFDTKENAEHCARLMAEQPALRDVQAAPEVFSA